MENVATAVKVPDPLSNVLYRKKFGGAGVPILPLLSVLIATAIIGGIVYIFAQKMTPTRNELKRMGYTKKINDQYSLKRLENGKNLAQMYEKSERLCSALFFHFNITPNSKFCKPRPVVLGKGKDAQTIGCMGTTFSVA